MRWLISLSLMLAASVGFAGERKRVVFLGDSITQAGQYVNYIDAYHFAHPKGDKEFEFINIGLSSETVSGLSEEGHPGKRPNVNDRLAKALELLKPDSVSICYGMNDGIYSPFSEERFAAYKKGMIEGVVERCEKAGAKVTLLTPFPFDAVPGAKKVVKKDAPKHGYQAPYEKYDEEVLGKYAEWIVSLKSDSRKVVDIHTAINNYIAEKRKSNPTFTVANDSVHPNAEGHREAARAILKAYYPGEGDEIDRFLNNVEKEQKDWFKLVTTRQQLLANSYRETTRGNAPKVSIDEATKRAVELEKQIRAGK